MVSKSESYTQIILLEFIEDTKEHTKNKPIMFSFEKLYLDFPIDETSSFKSPPDGGIACI